MLLFEAILATSVSSGNDPGTIVAAVVIGVILLAIIFRLIAGSMDDDRIRDHIEKQGGKIRSIDWSPFGRGWFGSKNERIYEVEYEDAQKNIRKAYCKTGAFSGVYWTEDNVIEAKPNSESSLDPAKLAEENRRLKEEIERLKSS